LLRTTKSRDRLANGRVVIGGEPASLHFGLDVHRFLLSGQNFFPLHLTAQSRGGFNRLPLEEKILAFRNAPKLPVFHDLTV
jgi:hypothetical protein